MTSGPMSEQPNDGSLLVTGYLSSHDPGSGSGWARDASVERLDVKWPSGRVQSWQKLPADRIVEIEEDRVELVELGKKKAAE